MDKIDYLSLWTSGFLTFGALMTFGHGAFLFGLVQIILAIINYMIFCKGLLNKD